MQQETFTCFLVNGYVRHDYNTSQTQLSVKAEVGKIYEIYANKNVLTVNGVSHTAEQAEFTATKSMCLGACDGYDTGVGNYLHGRIYYAKIYDNGTLVRDLVPCYRKSDGVIGMYDKVNHIFYQNAGTGTFGKGEDIGKISMLGVGDSALETSLSQKINNWTILGRQGNDLVYKQSSYEVRDLPSEYQQVEYIGFTGKEYIDTGYYANQDTKVEMQVYADNTWNQAFYCSRTGVMNNTFSCFKYLKPSEHIYEKCHFSFPFIDE